MALGNLQARLGHFEEANAAFVKANELAAGEAPAIRASTLAAVASHNLSVGTAAAALEAARKAVEAQTSPATLAVLARAQVRSNDGPAALKTADAAIAALWARRTRPRTKRRPLCSPTWVSSPTPSRPFGRRSSSTPSWPVRAGLALLLASAGKGAEAVAEAKKATEADPASGEAFAALGAAILAENPKSWGEAIAQAQQGAFENPRNPVVQTMVGRMFERAQPRSGRRRYRRPWRSDPGYCRRGSRSCKIECARATSKTPSLARPRVLSKSRRRTGRRGDVLLGKPLARNEH